MIWAGNIPKQSMTVMVMQYYEMSDIFKDMQEKVGCDYLSDLPSYKRKVWQEMKRLNPADHEERQLEDFSKYVFGTTYQTSQRHTAHRPILHLPDGIGGKAAHNDA